MWSTNAISGNLIPAYSYPFSSHSGAAIVPSYSWGQPATNVISWGGYAPVTTQLQPQLQFLTTAEPLQTGQRLSAMLQPRNVTPQPEKSITPRQTPRPPTFTDAPPLATKPSVHKAPNPKSKVRPPPVPTQIDSALFDLPPLPPQQPPPLQQQETGVRGELLNNSSTRSTSPPNIPPLASLYTEHHPTCDILYSHGLPLQELATQQQQDHQQQQQGLTALPTQQFVPQQYAPVAPSTTQPLPGNSMQGGVPQAPDGSPPSPGPSRSASPTSPTYQYYQEEDNFVGPTTTTQQQAVGNKDYNCDYDDPGTPVGSSTEPCSDPFTHPTGSTEPTSVPPTPSTSGVQPNFGSTTNTTATVGQSVGACAQQFGVDGPSSGSVSSSVQNFPPESVGTTGSTWNGTNNEKSTPAGSFENPQYQLRNPSGLSENAYVSGSFENPQYDNRSVPGSFENSQYHTQYQYDHTTDNQQYHSPELGQGEAAAAGGGHNQQQQYYGNQAYYQHGVAGGGPSNFRHPSQSARDSRRRVQPPLSPTSSSRRGRSVDTLKRAKPGILKYALGKSWEERLATPSAAFASTTPREPFKHSSNQQCSHMVDVSSSGRTSKGRQRPSDNFVNFAPANERFPFPDTDGPGPAAYDQKQNTLGAVVNQPDGIYYNHQQQTQQQQHSNFSSSPYRSSSNSRPSPCFRSTSPRLAISRQEKLAAETPGPGSYFEQPYFNGGFMDEELLTQQPSQRHYGHPPLPSAANRSNVPRCPPLTAQAVSDTPGPGAYFQADEGLESQTTQKPMVSPRGTAGFRNMSPKLAIPRIDEHPGPGAYDPYSPQQHDDFGTQRVSAGHKQLTRGSGRKTFGFGERFKHVRETPQETPGPGEYEIP